MTEVNYCAGSASACLDLVFEAAETEAAYLQNTCPPAPTCHGQLTLPVLLPLLQSPFSAISFVTMNIGV